MTQRRSGRPVSRRGCLAGGFTKVFVISDGLSVCPPMLRHQPMRDIRFDNLRGILVFSVVFGHLIEAGLAQGGLLRNVYILIYLVHMPLFAALSGYFSAGSTNFPRLFKTVILPFLVAELAYRAFHFGLTGKIHSFVEPFWHLWFLLSLACWRLILPVWKRLKFPVITALAISLIVGGIDAIGLPFSLSRTIYFFPFFLVGYLLPKWPIDKPSHRLWGAVVLLAAAMIVTALPENYSLSWLYGAYGYANQGVGFVEGAAIRAAHYGASLLLGFAVFSLIPNVQSVISVIGTHTMAIFLGHGFIVLLLRKIGFDETQNVLLIAPFLAVAIVYALGVVGRPRPTTPL